MVETEVHVLIDCSDERLSVLRENFMLTAYRTVSAVPRMRADLTRSTALLKALIGRPCLHALLAAYVFDVFEWCAVVPMYVQPSIS